MVLEELKLPYLIDAKMSLGEGSGAVAAIPLLEMGVNVYRKMSTFEEIKVEQYEEVKMRSKKNVVIERNDHCNRYVF